MAGRLRAGEILGQGLVGLGSGIAGGLNQQTQRLVSQQRIDEERDFRSQQTAAAQDFSAARDTAMREQQKSRDAAMRDQQIKMERIRSLESRIKAGGGGPAPAKSRLTDSFQKEVSRRRGSWTNSLTELLHQIGPVAGVDTSQTSPEGQAANRAALTAWADKNPESEATKKYRALQQNERAKLFGTFVNYGLNDPRQYGGLREFVDFGKAEQLGDLTADQRIMQFYQDEMERRQLHGRQQDMLQAQLNDLYGLGNDTTGSPELGSYVGVAPPDPAMPNQNAESPSEPFSMVPPEGYLSVLRDDGAGPETRAAVLSGEITSDQADAADLILQAVQSGDLSEEDAMLAIDEIESMAQSPSFETEPTQSLMSDGLASLPPGLGFEFGMPDTPPLLPDLPGNAPQGSGLAPIYGGPGWVPPEPKPPAASSANPEPATVNAEGGTFLTREGERRKPDDDKAQSPETGWVDVEPGEEYVPPDRGVFGNLSASVGRALGISGVTATPLTDELPTRDEFLLSMTGGVGRISSPYGPRKRPMPGASADHEGYDLAAPRGTPVVAQVEGVVIESGFQKGFGNYVKVKLPDGRKAVWAHLDTPSGLAKNDPVTADTIVGKVGSTGRASGNNLHFEIQGKKPSDWGLWREE